MAQRVSPAASPALEAPLGGRDLTRRGPLRRLRPTDPNVLWDTRHRLDAYDVLRPDEIQKAMSLLLTTDDPKGHGQVYAALDPALERFNALDDEARLEFKDALDKFVRTYSFVSQIVSFQNTGLERDYQYCRALAAYLRSAATVERLDLGSEVELTHLRMEMTYEGSIALRGEVGEVKGLREARGARGTSRTSSPSRGSWTR